MLHMYSLICTVISKSPAELFTLIGAVLELHSCANLPCLVKLAPNDQNLISQGVILFHGNDIYHDS